MYNNKRPEPRNSRNRLKSVNKHNQHMKKSEQSYNIDRSNRRDSKDKKKNLWKMSNWMSNWTFWLNFSELISTEFSKWYHRVSSISVGLQLGSPVVVDCSDQKVQSCRKLFKILWTNRQKLDPLGFYSWNNFN